MEQEPISVRLPICQLTINPAYRDLTPPLKAAELHDLRKSIEETGGILYPIIVEYTQSHKSYVIIDGHHRVNIAQTLGILELPCLQIFTEPQRQEALLSNINRRQLPDHERARIRTEAHKLFTEARDTLIPPLRELHRKGLLTKYIGTLNVQRLIGSSLAEQEQFYHTIRTAFTIPATVDTPDLATLEELKQTTAALAVTEAAKRQLEARLEETEEQVRALEGQIEELDTQQTTSISREQAADRQRLTVQISGLEQQIHTLTEEKRKASHTIQTLKDQVQAAETEMKAAQITARSAEQRLQTSSIQSGAPGLIATSLASLQKLLKTIHAMVEHAQPLEADQIRGFQVETATAKTLLAAIEEALLPAKADIGPGARNRRTK